MSEVWPTLSVDSRREDFDQFVIDDPTTRSLSQDGRVLTRGAPKRLLYGFSFELRNMTPEDKELLEDFQATVRVGDTVILWTDPRPTSSGEPVVRGVHLALPLVFDLDDEGFHYRTVVLFYEDADYAEQESGA